MKGPFVDKYNLTFCFQVFLPTIEKLQYALLNNMFHQEEVMSYSILQIMLDASWPKVDWKPDIIISKTNLCLR